MRGFSCACRIRDGLHQAHAVAIRDFPRGPTGTNGPATTHREDAGETIAARCIGGVQTVYRKTELRPANSFNGRRRRFILGRGGQRSILARHPPKNRHASCRGSDSRGEKKKGLCLAKGPPMIWIVPIAAISAAVGPELHRNRPEIISPAAGNEINGGAIFPNTERGPAPSSTTLALHTALLM